MSTTGLTAIFGETSAFSAFTASQQAAATIALSLWDDLIAPDLVLTTATNSNIEFANSFDGTLSDYAAAYFPSGGTVWVNNAYSGTGNSGFNSLNNNLVNPVIGRHGFSTYVHEIGHAFGLEHSGDYNGSPASPSNYRDSTVYSIMSYFGPSWGSQGAQGDVAWADWVDSNGVLYEPQTMMIDDILAIQSIYGEETTTRTGNTTYGFNSTLSSVQGGIYDFATNLNPILCLYDSGGIDTLDVSGWNTQSLIDLNAGAFSSANSMTNNISIAYGVTIENASTGSGNDTLTGNAAANVLNGGAGTDSLNGGLGNDTLVGGVGADQLNGGGGNDTASYATSVTGVTVNLNLTTAQVSGGDASGDVLTAISNLIGSSGGDTLTGNGAANILNGGLGDDTLIGGLGADQVIGDIGIDTAYYYDSVIGVIANLVTNLGLNGEAEGDSYSSIENVIGSNAGGDVLTGGNENNFFNGYGGADTLDGGGGGDSLFGGDGDDILRPGVGFDYVVGGNNMDTADYSTSAVGVGVHLFFGGGFAGDAIGDGIVDVENIIGSLTAGDTIYGSASANILQGQGGNDIIHGSAGSDVMDGGAGTSDTAWYFASTDAITANLSSGTGVGGDAAGDTFIGIENLIGSNNFVTGDTLTGSDSANFINSYGGADTINGGLGNDTLYGGVNGDTFRYTDTLFGFDVIGDWEDGSDKVSLAANVATTMAQVALQQLSATAWFVTIGTQGITVNAAAAFTLDAGDFVFV